MYCLLIWCTVTCGSVLFNYAIAAAREFWGRPTRPTRESVRDHQIISSTPPGAKLEFRLDPVAGEEGRDAAPTRKFAFHHSLSHGKKPWSLFCLFCAGNLSCFYVADRLHGHRTSGLKSYDPPWVLFIQWNCLDIWSITYMINIGSTELWTRTRYNLSAVYCDALKMHQVIFVVSNE